MASSPLKSNRRQITGNAALFFVAWQLSRRGWHVMPTIRNARGSDLFVANGDETVFFGVQSKGQSGRDDIKVATVREGDIIDHILSDWWIITNEPSSHEPTCYILTKAEVAERAKRDRDGQCWIKLARCDEFRDAWDRLGAAID